MLRTISFTPLTCVEHESPATGKADVFYFRRFVGVLSLLSTRSNGMSTQALDTAYWMRLTDCSLSDQEQCQQKALWNMGCLWPNGCTLVVRYMNGSVAQHTFVEKCLLEWESFANIKFHICHENSARSDIQIRFNSDGRNESTIGTSKFQPGAVDLPMLLSLSPNLMDPDVDRRLVLHGFGHALGLHHEHQSPNRPYRIKNEEAYVLYPNQSPQEVDKNMVHVSNGLSIIFPYDPSSIMGYGLAAEIRTCIHDSNKPCNLHLRHPLVLSAGDKRKIAAIYPRPSGRSFDMLLNGSRQQYNITFPQHPMCPPRVILGLEAGEFRHCTVRVWCSFRRYPQLSSILARGKKRLSWSFDAAASGSILSAQV
ncbi:peptidase M12 [Venturia nashicola]|nr:peptidase M12 [Venturia nashicola]